MKKRTRAVAIPRPAPKPPRSPVTSPTFKFDLEPMRKFRPEEIIKKSGDDRVDTFILALALVYNDLKGLLTFREVLLPHEPPLGPGLSELAGEWAGLLIQIHRLLVGHVHELLELIKAFEAEANGPELQRLLEHAPSVTRGRWRDLVNIATEASSGGDAAFTKILAKTRHNAVYHYYQPKALVKGFRHHFFESPKAPLNEAAYASTGQNLHRSRFYFADAAVEGALLEFVGSIGTKKFNEQLLRAIGSVNVTIAYIVSRRIKRAEFPSE